VKRVLICGAGVVGQCCALYLREAGHEVTVVDRSDATGDRCSIGNSGLLVPSHFTPLAAPGVISMGLRWMFDSSSPFYIQPRLDPALLGWIIRFALAANRRNVERAGPVLRDMLLASRGLYEQLADRSANAFGLTKRGLMMLCRTKHGLDDEVKAARRARALDIPLEIVSPQRAAELDPGARMDIEGAVFYPLDCHLDPPRLLSTLQQLNVAAGVKTLWSTELTGWRIGDGRIDAARTSRGEIEADEFVLAGGSWSAMMVRGLGLNLPLQAGKGYSLTLSQPRELPRMSSILCVARAAVTPMGTSLRVGGTMELGGLDGTIRQERVRAIAKAATQYFPAFRVEDFASVRPWAGLRPCSPDGLPYIGRFGRYSNLCAATGHAMLGVSLAPITGKLVSDILGGVPPRVPIEALSPRRYS
jgi:D-amino-acid dehydrogenase